MKNLLLILLLANILYFVWGLISNEESQPGVAIVEESDLGPPLDVTAGPNSDAVASVGAVLGSGEPSALEAIVGRSCVSIGPFKENPDAQAAVRTYSDEGMRAVIRSANAQIFIGNWVQIRNVADDSAARVMLEKLAAGGLYDAVKVRTEDEGLKISLGLFSDMDGAEKIEIQAKSLGLAAEISPFMRAEDVFFVDIGLPPGKGAGAIVERYGEDRVHLRGAATCPQ